MVSCAIGRLGIVKRFARFLVKFVYFVAIIFAIVGFFIVVNGTFSISVNGGEASAIQQGIIVVWGIGLAIIPYAIARMFDKLLS
jgi:hypothetical protein